MELAQGEEQCSRNENADNCRAANKSESLLHHAVTYEAPATQTSDVSPLPGGGKVKTRLKKSDWEEREIWEIRRDADENLDGDGSP